MNDQKHHSHLGGHDHDHGHGPGHNLGSDHQHMHSHVHVDPDKERLDRLSALAATFIESFRKADDKPAFLELSGIPQTRLGSDGLKLHLVDAAIKSVWQMGTASPAFGSRELAYLPYPAALVQERETMTLTYVSLTERADIDLITLLEDRSAQDSKDKNP